MMKSVAIAGLGAIGSYIASKIESIPGLSLVAVADRDTDEAHTKLSALGLTTVEVLPLDYLTQSADIIIEALPAGCAKALYEQAITQGKTLVALSTGVLLRNAELIHEAQRTGARIVVPSGAVGGLDALKAAREGALRSVKMITTKPPKSLAGAPYLMEAGIDLQALSKPTLIFEGNAIQAASAFPANVNVVAAVSMAGLGGERTEIEVWADPDAEQNSHRVQVRSDSTDFVIEMKNYPSPSNPRTSMLASLSVIAALRQLTDACSIGT